MNDLIKIKSAFISVYYKDGLDLLVKELDKLGVKIYSTGGTQAFIEKLGIEVAAVESLTSYPSILGGRVKTLHPKVFGGILARRNEANDIKQLEQYEIPEIDLVIVDLYPFEETVKSDASEQEIIEKIDIGGISLIRAAAKNFADVAIIPSRNQYAQLINLLKTQNGELSLNQRSELAKEAFQVSSAYDIAIYNYFAKENTDYFKLSIANKQPLRYGENPHQKAHFYGNLQDVFEQIHGKDISYNNLLDIDAAINLINDFADTTFAILKHNNACGIASRDNLSEAWKAALQADPISAFGGVLITNRELDKETAEDITKLFFEVIIAPAYSADALEILKTKKNRVILIHKQSELAKVQHRVILNGVLVQEKDTKVELESEMNPVTINVPTKEQYEDLIFANIVVKHSKSNAIVLVKNKQLIASGVGETSRVDALKHAIEKAKHFKLDLEDAVMASDAFFPFADSVEIAHKEGITAVVQPGGSVRDKESIDYCNSNKIAMVFTGIRHFKH